MSKVFSVLSGAYINAGDFLIVHRTKELLMSIYPGCEIKEYKRNNKLDDYLEEINKSDALIIAGGPAYVGNMYPDVLPLVDDLETIKTKIITVGLGWYGKNISHDFLTKYKFTEKSKLLLDRIIKDAGFLSCRDWYTVKALNYNGYHNSLLTGCPAWYCLEKIDEKFPRVRWKTPKKICISDPAEAINIEEAFVLASHVKNLYPNAEIIFVFHRIENGNNKYDYLIDRLRKKRILIKNITGSIDGFSIYNDCDLHIGYRVHAHIYNLSRRNISILIEEDGRGAGVNEALGIQGIKAFNSTKINIPGNDYISKMRREIMRRYMLKAKIDTEYVCQEFDNYIYMLLANNFSQYDTAYESMRKYYTIMSEYIKGVLA